ncbi:MAG: formate dehydrogenase accessory sulfurtransferase FdhD [Nocardioidaceae bacterium]|nr:formate dehydrogenase accessory sulfurtransferase FdhD [Nocardioidaceae bacterium]MCL2611891.1 formate dehydrogenase accessory sulfurtransferase FdhD [Nocardioidaceae bacterium]
MGRVTARRPVLRIGPSGTTRRPDALAVEEPLEIRVDGAPLVVTMRTPGHDVDLAHGFLSSEGVIAEPADVVLARHCTDSDLNVLEVTLRDGGRRPPDRRAFAMTSACGVCGKESIEAVAREQRWPLPEPAPMLDAAAVLTLPDKLRVEQRVFERTGGIHAAGIFGPNGEVRVVREDVGRHNAVDKAVGWAVREGLLPLHDSVLVVSGRASYELVQKAVLAGIPVLVAVSAPSSLAVDLAEESGLTLAGFVRGESMNIYTHPERVLP